MDNYITVGETDTHTWLVRTRIKEETYPVELFVKEKITGLSVVLNLRRDTARNIGGSLKSAVDWLDAQEEDES